MSSQEKPGATIFGIISILFLGAAVILGVWVTNSFDIGIVILLIYASLNFLILHVAVLLENKLKKYIRDSIKEGKDPPK